MLLDKVVDVANSYLVSGSQEGLIQFCFSTKDCTAEDIFEIENWSNFSNFKVDFNLKELRNDIVTLKLHHRNEK